MELVGYEDDEAGSPLALDNGEFTEETMLFPSFEEEEANREEISELSAEIIREHEAAGEILLKLRLVTKDYAIPEDVCGTYIRAYESLLELEKDLHQHIHLENNILLKEYDIRK